MSQRYILTVIGGGEYERSGKRFEVFGKIVNCFALRFLPRSGAHLHVPGERDVIVNHFDQFFENYFTSLVSISFPTKSMGEPSGGGLALPRFYHAFSRKRLFFEKYKNNY